MPVTTEEATTALPLPTYEAVEHALRDLNYAERFVGHAMTPSAGNAAKDMYGLRDAVMFLTGNRWDAPMLNPGFKGTLHWVDVKKLVVWLRDVIGDADLAEAIHNEADGVEPYMSQSEIITRLVNARMLQYREVYDAHHGVASSTEEQAEPAE